MSRALAEARVDVLGIRHHGPGSARAVRAELERLRPDAVLVEGPADADPLAPLAVADGMVPPVALLAYAPERPERRGVLAARGVLAGVAGAGVGGRARGAAAVLRPAGGRGPGRRHQGPRPRIVTDPIAVLAEVAGYDDPERWWDDVVESRPRARSRAGSPRSPRRWPRCGRSPATVRRPARADGEGAGEERREAYMRQVLRAVVKDGAERVAVVCGAWHAPALDARLGGCRRRPRTPGC